MARLRRFDIKKLLQDPDLRRRMIVRSTIATQAREGIDVSKEEAENSYYVVSEGEQAVFFGLVPFRTEAGENDGRHIQFVRSLSSQNLDIASSVSLRDFSAIEDSPLVYDKVEILGPLFRNFPKLSPAYCETKQGLIATASERFVRYHWEIPSATIKRWVPYAKGGSFSRFYSDVYLIFDWTDDGKEIKELSKSLYGSASRTIKCEEYYFREGITWSERAKGLNARILPSGCIFNAKGPSAFLKDKSNTDFILGILNSSLTQAFMHCFGSTSWGCQYVAKIPTPPPHLPPSKTVAKNARTIFDIKKIWDAGNETSTEFTKPWILQIKTSDHNTLSIAFDEIERIESENNDRLEELYSELDDAVYMLHGVGHALRQRIESTISGWKRIGTVTDSYRRQYQVQRPPEIVWPQMEGKDRDQKRREHVDRLLCYLIKRIVEADEDGLVCFESVAHEPPLLARLRKELHTCFPQQDPTALETEVVNELKKKTKGYRRAESLAEWLQDVFFDTHTSLYQQRPLIWHLASNQVRRVPAIGVLVHAHKFNADALAKLRGTHLRDRLATLRREAGQASQDSREDDRLEALAAIEELEAYDASLKHLQDGHHTGPEGSDRDYRILTPWKSQSERPQGWNPDLDDGIKVNIAPLARTNLLRRKLRFAEAEKDD